MKHNSNVSLFIIAIILIIAIITVHVFYKPINSNFSIENKIKNDSFIPVEKQIPKEPKKVNSKEFSEKFSKIYTFDNLYTSDYSYEPIMYNTYGRHSIQFINNKVIVFDTYQEIAYSFNIDSITTVNKSIYSIECSNNKYKNCKVKVCFYKKGLRSGNIKCGWVAISLNNLVYFCFEHQESNQKERKCSKDGKYYFTNIAN